MEEDKLLAAGVVAYWRVETYEPGRSPKEACPVVLHKDGRFAFWAEYVHRPNHTGWWKWENERKEISHHLSRFIEGELVPDWVARDYFITFHETGEPFAIHHIPKVRDESLFRFSDLT